MKKCNICGSEQLTIQNKLPYFNVLKCRGCGVQFADKFPIEKKIKNIYSKKYYNAWTDKTGEIPKSVEIMKKNTFRRYLNLLSKYISFKGKNLLDIGCATGFFLEEACDLRCRCWGVELNPFGAKESLKKFPKKIFNGILEKSKYQNNFFDVITLVDLIEHTKDPLTVIGEVRRIVKKNGYILIVTPNTGGMWARVLGKKWTNYKEEHLYYFNEKSLKCVLKISGLKFVYGEAVMKTLTLRYICGQLETYKTPVLTTLTRVLKYLPSFILDFTFPMMTGDYLVVAKK